MFIALFSRSVHSSVGAKCMSLLRSSTFLRAAGSTNISSLRGSLLGLLQKIFIDSRLTIWNHNRANRFLIELYWPNSTDDAINVTKFA